jgi:hypothetical protein
MCLWRHCFSLIWLPGCWMYWMYNMCGVYINHWRNISSCWIYSRFVFCSYMKTLALSCQISWNCNYINVLIHEIWQIGSYRHNTNRNLSNQELPINWLVFRIWKQTPQHLQENEGVWSWWSLFNALESWFHIHFISRFWHKKVLMQCLNIVFCLEHNNQFFYFSHT